MSKLKKPGFVRPEEVPLELLKGGWIYQENWNVPDSPSPYPAGTIQLRMQATCPCEHRETGSVSSTVYPEALGDDPEALQYLRHDLLMELYREVYKHENG